jgi:hypothetical protein
LKHLLFILFFHTIFCFSQGTGLSDSIGRKYKVKTCTKLTYYGDNAGASFTYTSVYDQKGLAATCLWKGWPVSDQKYYFYYNEKDQLIKEINVSYYIKTKDSSKSTIRTFEYDQNGKLIKNFTPEYKPNCKYNAKGLMIEKMIGTGGEYKEKTTYQYDAKNNLIKESEISSGKVKEYDEYFYDKQGFLIRKVHVVPGVGSYPERKGSWTYTYNEKGLVSEIFANGCGERDGYKYSYTYYE